MFRSAVFGSSIRSISRTSGSEPKPTNAFSFRLNSSQFSELHVLDQVRTAETPLVPSVPAEPAALAVTRLAPLADGHSEAPVSAQV